MRIRNDARILAEGKYSSLGQIAALLKQHHDSNISDGTVGEQVVILSKHVDVQLNFTVKPE